MNPNALTATVVSEDAMLLREISRALAAYGYETRACRQVDSLVTAWKASQPDFLIVDHSHRDAATVSRLPHLGHGRFTYKILMCDLKESLDQIAELEHSFNDVVSKPLVLGELIARLRAGERFLEFEQSLREQSLCDHCTGLLSRNGLLTALELILQSSTTGNSEDETSGETGLVLMSLDSFSDVATRYGTEIRDQLLCEAAGMLEESAGGQTWLARTGPHVFALALSHQTVAEMEQLAENIRTNVAARQFNVRGEIVHLTATVCVTQCGRTQRGGATTTPELALAESERRLQEAETLGGNFLARQVQFDEADAASIERGTNSGATLSKLTARDVMTPFAVILRETELSDSHLAAVRASAAPIAPYFDHQGEYLGIVRETAWRDASRTRFTTLLETLPEVGERTSWAELSERMTDRQQDWLVVMGNRKPLGYITSQAITEITAPAPGH